MKGRVLLITMPFGPMTRPSIGISLLKSELTARGIACDIRYFNLFFARLIGPETYHELSENIPASSLLGDWLFRESLFGPDAKQDREFIEKYLPSQYPGVFDPAQLNFYVECRSLVTPFLEACLKDVDWSRYSLVGFSSTFQQNVSSLALAQRIKERFTHIKVAFGGANCEGVMGQELHRQFSFVDLVFSGESDGTFALAAETMLRDPDGPVPRLPGLTSRIGKASEVVSTAQQIVQNLDVLPFPDYSDFVSSLAAHGLASKHKIQFLIETSRGCWWGEKHHCTFCGLNGQSLEFRSKSPERVIAELVYLVNTYGAQTIWATDNILDHRYFNTVLPAIKELGLHLDLFFETKANLQKHHLKLMRDVGITWFQPGIESLNTHQLQLMNKGCTALQNIQLLKWARQYGMLVTWNMLMGFPGETLNDYKRLVRYCEAIMHLQPPSGAHIIRLDRFSPYFNHPDAYGITEILPDPSYRYVYPFPSESLGKLAYFFIFRYTDGYDPIKVGFPLLKTIAKWLRPESFSVLYAIPGDELLVVCDTRPGSRENRLVLSGFQKEIYQFCDAVHSFRAIVALSAERFPHVSPGEIRTFLEQMVEKRLMLEENDSFLSLAILINQETDLGAIPDQRRVDRSSGCSQDKVAPL